MTNLTARCKAFTGQGVRTHDILIDEYQTILVWDVVAGYYTNCHILSDRQQSRLLKLAGIE